MSYWRKVVCFAALLAAGCNNELLKGDPDGGCCDLDGDGVAGGKRGHGNGNGDAGTVADAGTDAGMPCVPADGGTASNPTYTRDWVVSPTGSDTAAGTAASPFRTITRGVQAASPGERVLVMPGTYAERIALVSGVQSGTVDRPIRLQGVDRPKILPGAGWTMVQVERSHWQIDGFDIDAQGTAHVGVGIANAQGVSITGSHIHHGSHNGGIAIYSYARGVLIEGNEIDHFWREPISDSHGIGIQWTTRDITIRNNLIHENSGDSIQCEGPEPYDPSLPPADNIVIEGNEMYGDYEQAIDIKTCNNVRIANNWIHDYTQWPVGNSMVIHMSASNVTVEDNRIYNVGEGIAIGGVRVGPVPFNVVVRRNRIWGVHRNGTRFNGIGIRLENSEQAKVLNNTIWNTTFAAIKAGGCSEGNTSNLVSRNNILAPSPGGYAYYFGSCLIGLGSGPNLFAPNASISALSGSGGRETLSLATWKLSGQDATSRVADPGLDASTLAPGSAAVDWGRDVGLSYCGTAPDLGALETGCLVVPICS